MTGKLLEPGPGPWWPHNCCHARLSPRWHRARHVAMFDDVHNGVYKTRRKQPATYEHLLLAAIFPISAFVNKHPLTLSASGDITDKHASQFLVETTYLNTNSSSVLIDS